MQVDILELWLQLLAYPGKAVWCCQHDYIPKSLVKFDGHQQTKYPRKNWSSFMVFDNARCQVLTPELVNTSTGLYLHRFLWLEESVVDKTGHVTPPLAFEREVGSLPLTWNWLVGEYEPNARAENLHFTNGTPCFADYADCDHAAAWWDEYRAMLAPALATERALALKSVLT